MMPSTLTSTTTGPTPQPAEAPSEPRTLTARLVGLSVRRPRAVMYTVLAAVLIAGLGFTRLQVDTDPENMLPSDDPVRQRNALMAEEFGTGPMIVVGLFGDVETVEGFAALADVHDGLTSRSDVVAEATVSPTVATQDVPTSQSEVDAIVQRVEADPLLGGNVLFADADGAAFFISLTEKGAATDVADAAQALIAEQPALAGLVVSVAGQPLAEDAFGQEMFVQMAIFAPLAGLLVFAILYLFFRRLQLVIPAMLVAMATVILTMGALVGTGNTLHIMSSMIPIFLMPVAILDSVHVLSEFFDRHNGDPATRAETLTEILTDLGRAIGFTSLTTAVGFGSLVLVPIPPVRVFGLFVAIGVGLAWLFTLTLLPAYLVTRGDKRTAPAAVPQDSRLADLGRFVAARRRMVLAAFLLLGAVAAPGLASMTVNDNPVRWFRSGHDVRLATEDLGAVLPGTFTANLLATGTDSGALNNQATASAVNALANELRTLPEVGAVQTWVDGDHPALRAGELGNIRLQLVSGDNVAMQAVVDRAEAHLAANPVPGVTLEWAGESYLNLTWQQKMVSGMLVGFATTLVVVFALLILLFRSVRWAALAMAPVLWTILVVYGAMAMLGRDVDMPVAVLSTMVVGIGVDFAIHFVARYRSLLAAHGSSGAALNAFFGEPARAMTRNAMVIAIGFSPLLLSSLVPYVVVGTLLASIVGLSWLASIIALPAMVARDDRWLGPPTSPSPTE